MAFGESLGEDGADPNMVLGEELGDEEQGRVLASWTSGISHKSPSLITCLPLLFVLGPWDD